MVIEEGFRADLLVENRVMVELKSVERLASVHGRQLLTYLKLTNMPVGLLINVGAAILREGLHRIVNGLPRSATPRLRVKPISPGHRRLAASLTSQRRTMIPLHRAETLF